jgi:hypothetical protein
MSMLLLAKGEGIYSEMVVEGWHRDVYSNSPILNENGIKVYYRKRKLLIEFFDLFDLIKFQIIYNLNTNILVLINSPPSHGGVRGIVCLK